MKTVCKLGNMVNVAKWHYAALLLSCALCAAFSTVGIRDHDNMILIEGGSLTVSVSAERLVIPDFYLDEHLVTVSEFGQFVRETGYVTDAEQFGDGGVFDYESRSWTLVKGATFRFPFGPDKPPALPDHPVTQVTWNDANAYATWKGKRLPTQWEWEFAAGNRGDGEQLYSWGESLVIDGSYKANTWQGSFPFLNTMEDGYLTTSPVGVYGPNKLGLTDMGGNVWQWCSDSVAASPSDRIVDQSSRRVMRGGSFLCDPMVCHGYTVSGTSSSTPETSMVHIGFRCARDKK